MGDEKIINTEKFVNARTKEIKVIEESLKHKSKKTLVWQRMPFYMRRRNRNHDFVSKKKFSFRKKDRHFLRTHTYYAKRFFMLQINKERKISIPYKRHLKSSSFIYKSTCRNSESVGCVFDESFKGVYYYENVSENISDQKGLFRTDKLVFSVGAPIIKQGTTNSVEGDKLDTSNSGEDDKVNISYCSLAVYLSKVGSIENLLKNIDDCFVFKMGSTIETHKIICKREKVMEVFQILINNKIIPICLEEVFRIATENDVITEYDMINTELFKNIESTILQTLKDKYNKTPRGKKNEYDLNELGLYDENFKGNYFIFKILKKSVKPYAKIFNQENILIGRVIRASFKYTSGCCYGVGIGFKEMKFDEIKIKNLDHENTIDGIIVKKLNQQV